MSRYTVLLSTMVCSLGVASLAAPAFASPPAVTRLSVQTHASDPGLRISANATGTRILVKGVAEGPFVKSSGYDIGAHGQKIPSVEYTVARGVGFEIGHDQMPDFSKDPDYTRKNQWYFKWAASHAPSVETQKGASAVEVAQKLASSLNKGGAFEATVSDTRKGAVIDLKPR